MSGAGSVCPAKHLLSNPLRKSMIIPDVMEYKKQYAPDKSYTKIQKNIHMHTP